MEIQGKIILDLPLQQGVSKAGNPWKKKEWVLETTGTQYPRQVKFDFFGDRADSNPLQVGQEYIISFDLESREFNGRWYTDVRAFASRPVDGSVPGAGQNFGQQQFGQPQQQFAQPQQPQQNFAQQPQQNFAPQQPPQFQQSDDESDLPF